jgi:hypothetical protein
MRQDGLIERFIASFDKLDEMTENPEIYPLVSQLAVGSPDPYGRLRWSPMKVSTDASQLDFLMAKLPARLPPLYEQLILSYRWAEVDLRTFRLLPNPPPAGLDAMFTEMSRDPAFWKSLPQAGYIQFGRGPDMDYDPVCFDIRSRTKSKDYRVVKIDHEEILCNNRVKVVSELAPSFERLMVQTIELADRANGMGAPPE